MSKLSTNLLILKKGFPGAYLKEHANDVMMMMLGKKRKLPMTISNWKFTTVSIGGGVSTSRAGHEMCL
jgi:hypothetical protein